MTLTNATWSNSAKQGNVRENWLFKFFYDTETANEFTGLSLADTTVSSVFYHGVITSRPRIRSRIDLAKSTASTDNLTITIADKPFKTAYAVQDTLLSGEMGLGGTRKYINRKVEVYSQLNGELTLSNCLQVGLFRLIGMSHKAGEMTLQLASHRPWDFITIPNTQTSSSDIYVKTYIPVAYGDFSNNSTPDFNTGTNNLRLYPAPYVSTEGNKRWYAACKDEASGVVVHHYETNIGAFSPINSSDTATTAKHNGELVSHPIELERTLKFRPTAVDDASDFNGANPEYAFDFTKATGQSNTVSSGGSSISASGAGGDDTEYLKLNMPELDGVFSTLTFNANTQVNINSFTLDVGGGILLEYQGFGAGDDIVERVTTSGPGTTANASYSKDIHSAYVTNDYKQEAPLSISNKAYTAGAGDTVAGTGSVFDVYYQGTIGFDFTNEPLASNKALNGVKYVYLGSDGLKGSWSGTPAITEIHEAHRDLLHRFAGFDSDNDLNSASWEAIESARNWKIRYWVLEPTELKKVLEQLQYEGGFIFKWKADGTGAYVFVADTYASADVDLTGRDIGPLTVGHTPFSELITKMEINYQKHPAENKYISNETSTNGSARTAWNIQTAENIKEINLDANIDAPWDGVTGSTNPNDDFYSYYDNIFGDIKLAASCAIVNPAHFTIETGDTVSFSDVQPEKAFNTTWITTDPVFMVTETQRGPGQLIITCREVT